MYTRFFGLNRLPFEASPDPRFLFDGPVHREAIASIDYAVATRMGFIMLTGEVGLGKTTVVRAFLDRFDRQKLLPIYVFHPLMSFDELLELLCDELGLTVESGVGSFNRLRAIQRELIRLYEAERQVILVIDEAQRLPEDTLENLRLLTNLETADTKLLQIVLVGQPELEAILGQPHLRQLEQRIVLKARLEKLKPDDALRYLRHRLTLAGAGDPETVMQAAALRAVVELGDGVPRRMNILANRTLIDAFGADEKPVTAARVRKVAAGNAPVGPTEMPQTTAASSRWPTVAAVAAIGLVAAVAVAWETHTLPLPLTFAAASPSPSPSPSPTPAAPAAAPPAETPTAPPSVQTAAVTAPAPVSALPPAAVSAPAPIPTVAAPVVAAPPPQPEPVPIAPVAAPAPAPTPSQTAAVQTSTMQTSTVQTAAVQPQSPAKGGPPHDTPYTVNPGDTLWKICVDAYGPDIAPSMISKVMTRNKIVSDVRLLYGKTIILPASGNS